MAARRRTRSSRPIRWIASLLAIPALLAVALAPPATAAPARGNSSTEAVYFVHGFNFPPGSPSTDCNVYWGKALTRFRNLGWTGSLISVAYYTGDINCSRRIASADRDMTIEELGRRLAWDIYNNYSVRGLSVDLVGHSMGGLIIRAAITGVARHLANWPTYLYVEDGVTIASPHNGTSLARACTIYWQCAEMQPGSYFLNTWLISNVQSTQGTDWTFLGFKDDDVVPVYSATTEKTAGHYLVFDAGQPLEHSQQTSNVSGTTNFAWWNYKDPTWYHTSPSQPGQDVIQLVKNAAYYWSDR